MIRRFGESVKNDIFYTRRPGVYALLPIRQNLLLTHQNVPKPEFQLPGGGVDPDEHPIRALHREVMEETGWIIDRPKRIGSFRRFVFMPEYDLWAEKFCTVYLAYPVLRRGVPTEEGHSDFILPAKLALELVENPGDRYFISNFISGNIF